MDEFNQRDRPEPEIVIDEDSVGGSAEFQVKFNLDVRSTRDESKDQR